MAEPIDNEKNATVWGKTELSISDLIGFFLKYWLWIILPGVVTGAAVFCFYSFFRTPLYETSALLIVVPPRFSSDLKPPVLTIQAYRNLLESDAVLGETKARLIKNKKWPAHRELRIGEMLETRIFVSRLREETSLAPMLELVARDSTPAGAESVANTWAGVFIEKTRELVKGSTSTTVDLLFEKFPAASIELQELERNRTEAANIYQRQYDAAANRWDNELLGFRQDTADLLAAYQAETKRLTDEFSSEQNLSISQTKIEAMQEVYRANQLELGSVALRLRNKQLQLDEVRNQLKITPSVLEYQKAITDEALWQQLDKGTSGSVDWAKLKERALISQEANPLYESLLDLAAKTEIDVRALLPEAAELTRQLETSFGEIKSLKKALAADLAKLEKLVREREAGLEKLKAGRETANAIKERMRQQELEFMRREWRLTEDQHMRRLSQQRELVVELSSNFNQALLMKSTSETEDVRLAAAAVEPQSPVQFLTLLKLLFWIAAGGMSGLLAAFFKEIRKQPRVST